MVELLVPTMLKNYRVDEEEGKKKILKYLEDVRNNNFKGALAVWDISFTKEGFETLIKNLEEYEKSYMCELKVEER